VRVKLKTIDTVSVMCNPYLGYEIHAVCMTN